MKHCPPAPSPSTTDLAKPTPETPLVPVATDPAADQEVVTRLRIKVKAWFGRLNIEREMYRRR
jgi:hypothetical protein